jgi:cytidine deaminase
MTAHPTDPEDLKLIALARAALARTEMGQAACVRDTDGRTYAGARVELPHLKLPAASVAVAMAASSGATRLEAAAVAGEADPTPEELAVLADLAGDGFIVWSIDRAGDIRSRTVL